MRTWGRITVNGVKQWVEVSTDPNGANDMVYVTTLVQVLRLNLGESPFYSNVGIPGAQSVIQQVFPDYYASITQQLFSPYFASILITRPSNSYPPTYLVNVTTHQGVKINASVPIPT